MRLRNMPPFTSVALTVALGSAVQGAFHAGAAATMNGHWLMYGLRYGMHTCKDGGRLGCQMMQQIRVLRQFLIALYKAEYAGDITILTANVLAANLITNWRNGNEPELGWFSGDLRVSHKVVRDYAGRMDVQVLNSAPHSLVSLAGTLSDIGLEGVCGVQSREATESRAHQLVETFVAT
jgi:hypothetical protein